MKRSIYISANVKLNENINVWFHLPIRQPIRISFWLPDALEGTFSEIHFDQDVIEIGDYFCRIMLPIQDFTANLKKGDFFYFGTKPMAIGEGIVIEQIDRIH